MPTLQCTDCGATYHIGAGPPHLAVPPLKVGCDSCGSPGPLHIGVTSDSASVDGVTSGALEAPARQEA